MTAAGATLSLTLVGPVSGFGIDGRTIEAHVISGSDADWVEGTLSGQCEVGSSCHKFKAFTDTTPSGIPWNDGEGLGGLDLGLGDDLLTPPFRSMQGRAHLKLGIDHFPERRADRFGRLGAGQLHRGDLQGAVEPFEALSGQAKHVVGSQVGKVSVAMEVEMDVPFAAGQGPVLQQRGPPQNDLFRVTMSGLDVDAAAVRGK